MWSHRRDYLEQHRDRFQLGQAPVFNWVKLRVCCRIYVYRVYRERAPPPITFQHNNISHFAVSNSFTMVRTRLHNLIENQDDFDGDLRNDLHFTKEINLNVSTEEFLSAERAFTYADLHAMLGNDETVAWLTPHTAVARSGGRLVSAWDKINESCRFCFSVDGKDVSALTLSSEHLSEICDIVLRLLAVSVVHSIRLTNLSSTDLCINAPTLAYLMEKCQSLKFLSLKILEMDEDQCRVLGDYSRPDLEIVLDHCKITSAGASTLAEVLGRNQGPTMLDFCKVDSLLLVDGLRGNSRLKVFRAFISGSGEVREREFLAIAGAVKENKGLVYLDLSYGLKG
jgi:hypothetical protein